jgi:HCOMODA/2-hydroxy-3-carboxy-muconic semialdehyde decarboxylase
MADYITCSRDLVIANRILAREGVVDAYGHVSVRHPDSPQRFLLSQSRSPELVTLEDLMEFTLEGDAIDQQERAIYSERFIHGAVFEARPDIQAVVHNHSLAVIPFSITNTPIKPVVHVAALIGPNIPVWDIRDSFGDTSMLVTNMEQARDLAQAVGEGSVALMRGHGSVVAGRSIWEAVMASVYLQVNAQLLMDGLRLGEVTYLSDGETRLMAEAQMRPTSADRVWEYWVRRAGCEGI